jgi:exodeoxyribonuclease III
MSYQDCRDDLDPTVLTVLNWNIRNPSPQRAALQAKWIINSKSNIVILTELKQSSGCQQIVHLLESYGYQVFISTPEKNDYCVMTAVRGFLASSADLPVSYLNHRILGTKCRTASETISVVGIYVPSRGSVTERNVRKRNFQKHVTAALPDLTNASSASSLIIAGDLNVLERNHDPHHAVFGEWEYLFYDSFLESGLVDAYRLLHPKEPGHSWFGQKELGYRFDHLFVSKNLANRVIRCDYLSETRRLKLSDHSAMGATISL